MSGKAQQGLPPLEPGAEDSLGEDTLAEGLRPAPRLPALAAVLVVAAALRTMRALARWDEVAWLYAAYPGDTLQALAEGRLGAVLTTWTGLHPPAFAVLHSLQELVLPVPLVFLGTAAACSLGAVLLMLRRDLWAGLMLATSPVQLHYAAELNDYPLAVLLVAAAWLARPLARERWWLLGLVLLAASWTHVLAAAAVAFCLMGLPRGVVLRVLGLVALGCLPLLPGLLGALGEPGTFEQPPLEPSLILADLRARFGLLGLLWAVPALAGLRHLPVAGAAVGGTLAIIAGFVLMGVAAPHQFPYLLLIGPPLALLVSEGVGRHKALVLGLALVQGVWVATFDGVRLWRLVADQESVRAIDLAWSESGRPGDAILLLSPAGINDDDKGATSPVLWRLRPWWSMPPVLTPGQRYADHRLGQPRLVEGRVVYLDDHVRPQQAELLAGHERAWVVVSRPGRRAEYTTELQAILGLAPQKVEADHLYRLVAPASRGEGAGGGSPPSD